MRIKKTFQGSIPENKIVNAQSDSQTDTYSCDYINGIIENKINVIKNSLAVRYKSVSGLNLVAGDTYQLDLPTNTMFIEPLIQSRGSEYSGGTFVTPGTAYTRCNGTDLITNTSEYIGIWIYCSEDGLVTISDFRHCGSPVTGFRIWYFGNE